MNAHAPSRALYEEPDAPESITSPDSSPSKASHATGSPDRPSLDSIPILLDTPTRPARRQEFLEHQDIETPKLTREISRWSASTSTTATLDSEPLRTPHSSPEQLEQDAFTHKRRRAGTFGSAELRPMLPPLPDAHNPPARPSSATSRKRASTVAPAFEPRRNHRRRESIVTPPSSRPATATPTGERQRTVSQLRTTIRPSTAPALRQTRSAFTLTPPARPNTAVSQRPSTTTSLAAPLLLGKVEPASWHPITKQVLSLVIDQEGHREIEATFIFSRFDKTKSLFEFRPLCPTASPFHSSFQASPVLRRLLCDQTGRRDFLTRQAVLSVQKDGLQTVQGIDGKRKWRFVYEVAPRKNLVGKMMNGEKTLTPLLFICTAELLATDVSIKHKFLRAVKSMALPRLSSYPMEAQPRVVPAPKTTPAPQGFAWIEPIPARSRLIHAHSSPAVPQRPSTATTERPRTDSLAARPSTAGATADRTLLFRLS